MSKYSKKINNPKHLQSMQWFLFFYISYIPHIIFLELRKPNPLILLKKELLYLAKRLMGHDNVRARSHHVCLESAGWTIMYGIDQ